MATQDPESGDPFSSGGGAAAFDFAGFLRTSIKFWWIPVLCLVLGIGVGFFLMKNAAPEFVASSEIKVERRASTSAISLSGGPISVEGATSTEDLKTIERSFVNPMVMKRVVQEIKSAGLDGLTLGGWPLSKLNDDGIAGYLILYTKVLLIPDTRLIQVSFTNPNATMAQRICNMIVEQGIEYDRDQRISAVGVNIRYLKDEVKKMEENLRTSEEKLNSYTRTLRNVSIDSDMNMVATQLKDLNARTTEAKAERLRIESDLSQIEGCQNDPSKLLKIDSIQKMPSIISLRGQIAETSNKITKLSLRYREDNPYMRQAHSELEELQAALLSEVLAAPKKMEVALAGAKQKEEDLQREQSLQEEKVIQVRDLSVPSRVLQRQIDADRLAYEAALKRLSEELSQARSQPVLLQVVNPAAGGVPVASKGIKLFGTAVFVGLLLGFGIIFLIMQLDSSIRSSEEAEQVLGLSVLSAVPEYLAPKDPPAGSGSGWHNCPSVTDKFSAAAEGIRSLRASLKTLEDTEAGNFVLITSAVDADGKSFCAVNLAVAMAHAGQRTLLVDANLRRPGVEGAIFGNTGRHGLSNYLQKESGLPSLIHSTPVANLDMVPAGTPCLFPAETLTRQGILDFLSESRPLYDQIVVDSASLTTVSDTLSFARLFPFTCLVVRAGKTPKTSARRAVELLKRSGSRVSGIVLNFAPKPLHDLVPVFDSTAGTGHAKSQEVSCPACGRSFPSQAVLLEQTAEAEESTPGHVRRKCACGCVFSPPAPDQRDESPDGDRRRRVFGEILELLLAAGMNRDQARRQLLLTLKVWRNEISSGPRLDSSEAGQERNRLLENLISHLVSSGLSPAAAREKILGAAEVWRKAP